MREGTCAKPIPMFCSTKNLIKILSKPVSVCFCLFVLNTLVAILGTFIFKSKPTQPIFPSQFKLGVSLIMQD